MTNLNEYLSKLINQKGIKDFYFISGSYAFFKDFKDYKHKDIDVVVMSNKKINNFYNYNSIFKYVEFFTSEPFKSNLEFINRLLKIKKSRELLNFVCTDFINHYHFKIKDLKKVILLFDILPLKWNYYKMIANFYIKNNDFILTEEQRSKAYEEYKKYK